MGTKSALTPGTESGPVAIPDAGPAQDNFFVYLPGRKRLHAAVCRDFVCGVCEKPVILRYTPQTGNFRTVCSRNPEHRGFMTKAQQQRNELRRQEKRALDRQVFDGLPPEMREAILGKEKTNDGH